MIGVVTGVAALPMYDLDGVRGAHGELWSQVVMRLAGPGDVPSELSWDREPVADWRNPGLVLGQTCGWPLITELRDDVAVVGAFDYDIAGADGRPVYRSVLVAAEPRPLAAFRSTVAACNATDSLSGWVSLGVAFSGVAGAQPWFRALVETGSHHASVEAVRAGDAAIASIDAVTWALLERHDPALTSDLTIVGHGPSVPTLPLITRAGDVAQLRAALGAAVADPTSGSWRSDLLIRRFHPLGLADYDHLAPLGRIATAVLGDPSR